MELKEILKSVKGVGPATIRKIEAAGLKAYEIAIMSAEELARRAGIRTDIAAAVIRAVRSHLGLGFMTAREYAARRQAVGHITTGSRNLDGILGGGVETGIITEFFGEYGVGKTQLCYQLAVNVQLPRGKGGLSEPGKPAKVVFIDTEGTFYETRIIDMSKRWGLDPDTVLDNILVVKAINTDHQMAIVDELFNIVPKENIKLVIVDSVTSHFRAEYPGRENLAARQQKLNRHLHQLKLLASLFNIAVVVTNQVMARPDVYYGDPTQAVGGHVMGHAPGVRVYIRKGKGRLRIARVIDAPHLPEAEAQFVIDKDGIKDPQ